MEILENFDFDKRPSRSRYAPVVDALINNGVKAVRIRRGDPEWPNGTNIESIQGAVADQIRKRGKNARTHRETDDSLIVGLNEKPAPARRRRERAVAAV